MGLAKKPTGTQQSDQDLKLISARTMDVLEGYIYVDGEMERDMDPYFVPETQASCDEPNDEPDFQECCTS